MKIYKELPVIFPFYENINHQNERLENRRAVCPFKLLSPENALLPFQLSLEADKPAPNKWEIVTACGGVTIDVSNNLGLIKVYEFTDRKNALYFGEPLTFQFEEILQELKLDSGRYYSRLTFGDGSFLISEIFTVPERSFRAGETPEWLLRVDFWNDSDIKPVIYRDDWRQTVYLDTFVHSAVPEVEEETEPDGLGNENPVFQKLVMRYKFVDSVPDFIKIPFISLQMSDNVYIYTGGRSGEIDRVTITATPDETGALNVLEVIFEDDVIIKTACGSEEVPVSVYNW